MGDRTQHRHRFRFPPQDGTNSLGEYNTGKCYCGATCRGRMLWDDALAAESYRSMPREIKQALQHNRKELQQ